MNWFGSRWDAPVCEDTEQVPTPGDPCANCGIPFDEHDRGIVLPFVGGVGDPTELPYHHGCLLWSLGITHSHILVAGSPLCGFMPGVVPGEWPKGHTWVYIHQWKEATCPGCRQEGERRRGQVA